MNFIDDSISFGGGFRRRRHFGWRSSWAELALFGHVRGSWTSLASISGHKDSHPASGVRLENVQVVRVGRIEIVFPHKEEIGIVAIEDPLICAFEV